MSNDDENVLKVSVSEEIKSNDVPPGTPAHAAQQIKEEGLPKDEVEKRQKVMLEYTRLISRYCKPHNKKSRWVTEADIPRVVADGKDLVAMCNIPRGKYSGIAALAHSQIDDQDPLRFFVLPNGMVIINPVITDHTKTPIFKEEGCMSFPDHDIKKMVPRYNKVNVTYQTLGRKDENSEPQLTKPATEYLTGANSHVFQHECGHLNGCNIYDEDYSADKSIGFGDGLPVDPNVWDTKVEKPEEELTDNK